MLIPIVLLQSRLQYNNKGKDRIILGLYAKVFIEKQIVKGEQYGDKAYKKTTPTLWF